MSRKTWIYFLKEKSKALDILKNFKIMVEKESGCMIKCFRTNRGGEFVSTAFNQFCSNEGIKRQLTVAYTPQQNGISERKNRTLMNMVRSMLAGRNVPKLFWPEAVKWACYVMNRSPTLSVKNMTPEEAWSGEKPSVHHFKVFGCLAFAHIPDSQRTKLDDKSIKCIHLGVSEESKAYKLYDPEKKKIIISRDVVFEEKKGWNLSNSDTKQVSDDDDSAVDIEETNESIHDDNAQEAYNSPDITPQATSSDERRT
jgi:hypothetical protein